MATPWLNLAQQQPQQQLPRQPQLSMQQPQPSQLLQPMQQLLQMPQLPKVQQVPQMPPAVENHQFLQNQLLPSPPQMQQPSAFGMMQQPEASFMTNPSQAAMQPAPVLNSDQLFRDPSLPQQSNVVEPSVSQNQMQPQMGGASLLSLLGVGQNQGYGPTDPPRQSPWIAMSDPSRDSPQPQFEQTNPGSMSFGQLGQSNMQMNPNMMEGNPSMMAFTQQQPIPGNVGCVLCRSEAAKEQPSENKWADYFSKGSDEKRRKQEAFE